MADAPARLKVEIDVDGFRCLLPGIPKGTNSSWLIPFVGLWWLGALVLLVVASSLNPELMDMQISVPLILVGAVATVGWGPGWMLLDRWWAARHPRPLEVDALGILYDGERWLFAELDRLTVGGGYLFIRSSEAGRSIRLNTFPHEEEWLESQVVPLFERIHARDGEVPGALRALVGEAESGASPPPSE